MQKPLHKCWCPKHRLLTHATEAAPTSAAPLSAVTGSFLRQQQGDLTASVAAGSRLLPPIGLPQQQHQQQEQRNQLAGQAEQTDLALSGASPAPQAHQKIVPSPSFAAALVLQQMRASQGFDALLPKGEGSTRQISMAAGTAPGLTRGSKSAVHRRLLQALQPELTAILQPDSGRPPEAASPAEALMAEHPTGPFNCTAEAVRQYHLQQRHGPAATAEVMLAEGAAEQQHKRQQFGVVLGEQQALAAPAGSIVSASAAAAAAAACDALGSIARAGAPDVQQQLQAAALPAEVHPVLVVPRVRAKKKVGAQQ